MSKLKDAFNPKTGEFRDNIRSLKDDDDTELRQLLQQFGWRKEFPAYVDENNVVIVGHRRLRIAKELGIEPVIVWLELGSGDAADVERFQIAIASNAGSKPMTKQDRQRLAEHLYGSKNWTMEAIGKALGVRKSTISKDLAEKVSSGNNQKHAKTASNPKGSGRHKSSEKQSKRGRETPKLDLARAVVREKIEADEPVNTNKLAKEHGISHVTFDMAITAEVARKEALAEPAIDPATLSLTAQEKLAAAIRQHQRRLDSEYEQRVSARVKELISDTVLPQYNKQYAIYTAINKARNGVMTKDHYRLIWSCLHPDSRGAVTEEKISRAFRIWTDIELLLLNEREQPTNAVPLPRNYEELMARKRAVQEKRRAQRAGAGAPARR